jgi:hypothetical protein
VSSLEVTDQQSRAVAKAPRVSLDDIKAAIAQRFDLGPSHLFTALGAWSTDEGRDGSPPARDVVDSLKCFSICLLVMKNGFTIIGKSAPASPENFDRELGKQFAYEDAVRQVWPLMGFALRDRLAAQIVFAEGRRATGCLRADNVPARRMPARSRRCSPACRRIPPARN